ncbi:MAG TPA: hypothetical protein VHO02_06620 [Fibrobacteria bacterium]|nr:hypothetical protein [Fibrobacteria bacterium]
MRIRFSAFSLPCLLAFLLPGASLADNARFFEPTPGYTRVTELPADLTGAVSSLEFHIYDAFEGSDAHSKAERTMYDIGNKLHIDTREATLRRRMPFRQGDTTSIDALRETEKRLREEEFLADAIIEVKRLPDSTFAVKVTTYDQWSTTLGVSLARKGGEWVGWFGPVESNVLGTGQRLGFFVSHDLERDSRWVDYSNTVFTPWQLSLLGQYAWLSDGNSYILSLSRPLRTREQHWGFTLSASGYESAENHYLSGNDLERLYDEGRLDTAYRGMLGRTNVLWQWRRVQDRTFYAGVTRSYGRALKFSLTPFYQGNVRATVPGYGYVEVPGLRDSLGIPPPSYDSRHDQLLGTTFAVYRYAYKTVHNFRNLKWSENIETGWRLSLSAGLNQEWLGASDRDSWYAYTGVYNEAWHDALFLNSSATLKHFVHPDGTLENGSGAGYAELQWKPIPALATVAVGQYDRLFAQAGDHKLYLGEESGLLGYPNFYYAGDSRLLASLEQRFFPPWEFGTIVPALAAFCIAGDAWDGGSVMPPAGGPHYAAGIGLRLGATRSVQKVVNHFNLTWPLGEKHASGPVFGVRAAKNL